MRGFWALVRFVSLRHIASAPVRSLLTLMGVALGVAMVVGMSASNASVLHAFNEMADRARGKADLEVTGGESGVDQGLVDELSARSDLVSHVAGRIEQTSLIQADGSPPRRVLMLGVDFLGDKEFLPFQSEGASNIIADPLTFLNDPNAILISDTLAQTLHVGVGSTTRMRTAEGMTEFRVAAVLRETGKTLAFGGQLVVLFLDAAQLAMRRRGHVDRIDVELAPGVTLDDGRGALQGIVGGRGTVDRPSKRASQVARMSLTFQIGLQVQGMIAMLVGMFLIYNAVSVSVLQRRREIGILRSVGVSRRSVAGVFLAEATVVGLMGGGLGVLLGGVLARAVVAQYAPAVSRLYENIAAPPPSVTPGLAVLGVTVGLVATLLAAWVPARRASQTSPVETLRRDLHAVTRSRLPVRALLAAGLALGLSAFVVPVLRFPFVGFLSLGLLLVAATCATPAAVLTLSRPASRIAQSLFGLSARLGVDNVARELGRSALTTCALMLATSMSVTIASYSYSYETTCIEWLDQSVPADIFVTAGSPLVDRNSIAFSPAVADRIAELDGVDTVDGVRSMTVTTHDLRVELLATGTEIYLSHIANKHFRRVLDGPDPLPIHALVQEPSVFISENFAVRTGLRAGETLELRSPTGAHTFKIVAVVVDYSSDQGWLLMDRKYMSAFWEDDLVEAVDIYTKPGVDPYAVAAAIRAQLASASTVGGPGGDGGMFVSTNAALKAEVRQTIQQTFEISRSSEAVALAVAVLGVIGTMLAAVIDRIREIGVLRAIGATRRQVALAVVAEAGFLGLCAVVVGVIAAIPSTIVFVRVVGFAATGWSVPFRMPMVAVLRIAGSVLVFALISGLIPGWKAARLEITRALAYE